MSVHTRLFKENTILLILINIIVQVLREVRPGSPSLPSLGTHLDFVGAMQVGHTLLNIKVFSYLPKTQSK